MNESSEETPSVLGFGEEIGGRNRAGIQFPGNRCHARSRNSARQRSQVRTIQIVQAHGQIEGRTLADQ